MKKSRLSIALMTALLSVTALTGCNDDIKHSKEGVLIKYTHKDSGVSTSVTADEIFVELSKDSTKYSDIFNAIKSIIVRNYFTTVDETVTIEGTNDTYDLGKKQLAGIEQEARGLVKSDELDAETAANKNNTTKDKEMDKIFEREGVEDVDGLYLKHLDEVKTRRFDDNLKTYFMDEMKNGAKDETLRKYWAGYYEDMVPYHVSHILVKFSDSAGAGYTDTNIDQSDCEKLKTVVDELRTGTKKFQMIAKERSEDDGSAEKHGALGIMDYTTGYVNEFKLGIYAYEQIYGKNGVGAENEIERIQIPTTLNIKSKFESAVKESYGITNFSTEIPTVDISTFEELYRVRKQEKSPSAKTTVTDDYDETVMDNSSKIYPRNIIFNETLNRHTFAFVTGKDYEADEERFNYDSSSSKYLGEGVTGLHTYDSAKGDPEKLNGHTILSTVVAGEMRPIIMARAGSGYQGIHFIVVDRDPFTATDKNGVTMDEYYSALTTDQKGYDASKKTYVNFDSSETDLDSRANNLATTIQTFDDDKLSKYIFMKYLKKEEIKIEDAQLAYELETWINNSLKTKAKTESDSWEKTWNDYVKSLTRQNEERKSLVSKACRIGFDKDIKSTLVTGGDVATLRSTIEEKQAAVVEARKNLRGANATNEDTMKAALATAEANLKAAIGNTFEGYCISVGMTNEEIEAAAAKITSDTKTIEDLYNLKGGLCNDGTEHK